MNKYKEIVLELTHGDLKKINGQLCYLYDNKEIIIGYQDYLGKLLEESDKLIKEIERVATTFSDLQVEFNGEQLGRLQGKLYEIKGTLLMVVGTRKDK